MTAPSSENTVFANNLLRLMKIQNLSPKELAARVHISESTVSAWCRGEKKPYPALVKPLCATLCCGEDTLFGAETLTFSTPAKTEKAPSEPTAKAEKVSVEPAPKTAKTSVEAPTPAKTSAESPAPAKKPAVEKKPRQSKAPQTVSDKEKVLAAMRETRRDIKSLTKNMTVEDASSWIDLVVSSCIADVTDSFKSLGAVAKAGIPSSFMETPVIEDKYAELLDAARGASDEGLTMATTILRKFKA